MFLERGDEWRDLTPRGQAAGCQLEVVRTEEEKGPHAEERRARKKKEKGRSDGTRKHLNVESRILEKHILNRVNQSGSTAPVAVLLALTLHFVCECTFAFKTACMRARYLFLRESDPIFTSSVNKKKNKTKNKPTLAGGNFKSRPVGGSKNRTFHPPALKWVTPVPTQTWLTSFFFIWIFCNTIFIHFYTFAQRFLCQFGSCCFERGLYSHLEDEIGRWGGYLSWEKVISHEITLLHDGPCSIRPHFTQLICPGNVRLVQSSSLFFPPYFSILCNWKTFQGCLSHVLFPVVSDLVLSHHCMVCYLKLPNVFLG